MSLFTVTGMSSAADVDAVENWAKDVWSHAVLYENENNPILQKFAFTGRAQFDYVVIDGEGTTAGGPGRDLSYDNFNTRRLRAGFKAGLFQDFTLHVEADFDPDEDPFYRRLTDANLAWKPSDAFELKIGKQGMGFTLDGKTSSKELLTIDRSALSGNLWFSNEYIPGITVSGELGNWHYSTGFFSQGEQDNEFGEFNSGTSWVGTIGYDLSDMTGADTAVVAFDYVINEENPSSPALFTNRSFGQIASLNTIWEKDQYGFRGDVSFGDGFLGQPDVWGLVLMPYYDITDRLQLVARYTFLKSDGNDGVRYNGYDSIVVNGRRGDQYQEGYLGFNYYLYEHKIKLQTGLQYISMRDQANNGGAFDGFNLTTGIRFSW
ncbi:porin [Luteolibacter algae]